MIKDYSKQRIADIEKDMIAKLILAGDTVRDSAKENAPFKTGTLRDSIIRSEKLYIEENMSVIIGTNVHYARYQEFGTVYIPAKFFLTRAVTENEEKLKKIFAKKMK